MKATERWPAIVELIDLLVSLEKIALGQPRQHPGRLKAARRDDEHRHRLRHRDPACLLRRRRKKSSPPSGRSSQGIEFDALDNAPVKFVVLFIVPKNQFQTHLRTLASIAKFLNDRSVRESLAAPGRRRRFWRSSRSAPRSSDRRPRAAASRPWETGCDRLLMFGAIRFDATFQTLLTRELARALAAAGFPPAGEVVPATDPRFGDYQTSAALVLAKQLGENPRELAQKIITHLDVGPWSEPPPLPAPVSSISALKPAAVAAKAARACCATSVWVCRSRKSRHRIVIDFGSPNVAKPMHVGHIRSTVIGDALYSDRCNSSATTSSRQSHRRLGHAVRDDHLRLQAFARSGGAGARSDRRAGADLQDGQRTDEERPGGP